MRLKQSKTAKKQREKEPADLLIKLHETLNDEVKFQIFIDWMYREFSSEAILSFVEMIQFKQWLKQEIRKTGGSVVHLNDDKFDYKLYHKIPKSSIIYGQMDVMDEQVEAEIAEQETREPILSESASLSNKRFADTMTIVLEMTGVRSIRMRAKRIAHLLFKKYIEHRAEYELNISGELRDKYSELDKSDYAGVNLLQFVELFDEVIGEMVMYIRQSFFRFYISEH